MNVIHLQLVSEYTDRMSRGQQPANAAKSPRAAQAEATRAALITAARRLFVEKGYFNTGTEEVVAASGVGTRGALYHHFEDKRALFQAVFEQVEVVRWPRPAAQKRLATRSDGCARACSVSSMPRLLPRYSAFC